jgi:hypothetical protein
MERVAPDEPLLRGPLASARALVEIRDSLERGNDVLTEALATGQRFRGEEAPAQDLRDVFLQDRLDAFLLRGRTPRRSRG